MQLCHREKVKVVLLCSAGGLLEFFDFVIFALLATQISQVFFSIQNNITALLATFTTFAVGYLARPLGGIIFGHFGDKYGRKITFTYSILIMAISTFAIGLIPSYESIGIFAAILLILLRLLQGLCIGGEIPGAITYISEFWPQYKGFANSLVFFFLLNGTGVGFAFMALLTYYFTNEQLIDWGWRIPFLIGGIFGLLAYKLRKQLIELPSFSAYLSKEHKLPIFFVLHKQTRSLIFACILTAFSSMPLVMFFIFLPSYLSKVVKQDIVDINLKNSVAILFASILCVLIGFISDYYQVKRMKLLYGYIFSALVLSFPIFWIYNHQPQWSFIALCFSAFILALNWATTPAILASLFSSRTRYSAIGFSYSVGIGIVSGITPVLLIAGIDFMHNTMIPAYVLCAAALSCFIAIYLLKPKLT